MEREGGGSEERGAVEFDRPERTVGYGQTGRVLLTTLTREFFMPRFLERDEGEREPPYAEYPWDGVSGVRPFRLIEETLDAFHYATSSCGQRGI